jgi:hypothetical protein
MPHIGCYGKTKLIATRYMGIVGIRISRLVCIRCYRFLWQKGRQSRLHFRWKRKVVRTKKMKQITIDAMV